MQELAREVVLRAVSEVVAEPIERPRALIRRPVPLNIVPVELRYSRVL